MGMNQRANDFRQLKESNAGASEPDSPIGQSWHVMPKVARDFLSAGLADDAGLDKPALSDDSELEDYDGVPVF